MPPLRMEMWSFDCGTTQCNAGQFKVWEILQIAQLQIFSWQLQANCNAPICEDSESEGDQNDTCPRKFSTHCTDDEGGKLGTQIPFCIHSLGVVKTWTHLVECLKWDLYRRFPVQKDQSLNGTLIWPFSPYGTSFRQLSTHHVGKTGKPLIWVGY